MFLIRLSVGGQYLRYLIRSVNNNFLSLAKHLTAFIVFFSCFTNNLNMKPEPSPRSWTHFTKFERKSRFPGRTSLPVSSLTAKMRLQLRLSEAERWLRLRSGKFGTSSTGNYKLGWTMLMSALIIINNTVNNLYLSIFIGKMIIRHIFCRDSNLLVEWV